MGGTRRGLLHRCAIPATIVVLWNLGMEGAMSEAGRTVLAETLRKHLSASGHATAGELRQTVDATTRETYATSFTLESPMGKHRIIIEDDE